MSAPPAERVIETPSAIWARAAAALGELGGGLVEGEVQKVFRSQAGHLYIDLADGDAVIGCVMWRDAASGVAEIPRQGQLIQAEYRRLRVYAPRGQVQLDLLSLTPTGEGELLRRVHETLARLVADGLTEPSTKLPLPRFPRRVGLIAGRGSDAEADVLTALAQRYPACGVTLAPALVQGAQAVASVIDALGRLDREPEVDVIILARGGGSVEDLLPFSDERLCRAIAALQTPVITSIGHTKQRPNCDHVASAAAEVPARAAEYAVPSAADLLDRIERLGQDIGATTDRAVADARARVDRSAMRPAGRAALIAQTSRLDLERHRLITESRRGLDDQRRRAADSAERIEGALAAVPRPADLDRVRDRLHHGSESFRARLHTNEVALASTLGLIRARDWRERGFALVRRADGTLVCALDAVAPGERLQIHLKGGSVMTTVDAVIPDEHEESA